MMLLNLRTLSMLLLILFLLIASSVSASEQRFGDLVSELLFFSSFDHQSSADFSRGDSNIYTAKVYGQPEAGEQGIRIPEIDIIKNAGKYGDALHFRKKTKKVLYYQGKSNIPYADSNFSGTVSFWLSLDPEQDLAAGFSDPILVTDAVYNDSAYWVDFSDKNPRLFRMGFFGNLNEWNPKNIPPDKNLAFNKRLVTANDRPFGRSVWTHVAIVFDHINNPEAKALFYVNGRLQGEKDINEAFGWDVENARMYLGLNYIGKMDELAVFKKALSKEEINQIYVRETSLSTALIPVTNR